MTPTSTNTDRLLRIPEVADALGVSRGTVYNIIAAGRLATTAVESLTRVSEAELVAYIKRNTTAARRAK
jgi:excisionase family DNA binding protein